MRWLFILLLVLGSSAHAQSIINCSEGLEYDAIPEPWADHTRIFANGRVRIVMIDEIEPAFGPFHIVVLSPPYDILGARQCHKISGPNVIGFGGVKFDVLKANYDPAIGLIFDLPVHFYDTNGHPTPFETLRFTVNQATGLVTAQGEFR